MQLVFTILHVSTWSAAALLFVGLNRQFQSVNSFSLSGGRAGTGTSSLGEILFMSTNALSEDQSQQEDLTPGTVVTERYLYRFSPTKSAIQTPYAIEERQNYAVLDDKSLEPLGDKSIIFRGSGSKNDGAETENPSDHDSSSDIDVYTKIGPALYAVEGLRSQQEKDPDGHKDSSNYVMALYCMEHPEVFQGRGLEVGR